MTAYAAFLESRRQAADGTGFTPDALPGWLYDFQWDLVAWALRRGRAAIFADCGLGKTPMQLAWAEAVVRRTNRPVLILTLGIELKPSYYRQAIKNLETIGSEVEAQDLFA